MIASHVKQQYVGYGFSNTYVDQNIIKFYILYVSPKSATVAIEAAWNQDDKDFRTLLGNIRLRGGTFEEFSKLFEYEIIRKLWFGQAAGTGFRNSEILKSFMPEYLMAPNSIRRFNQSELK